MRHRLSCAALVVFCLGFCLGAARAASPAEISAFVTGGSPGETWSTGYGGMLTITLFNIVGGEVEGTWQGSAFADTSIVTGMSFSWV